jgi:hypothetical protein
MMHVEPRYPITGTYITMVMLVTLALWLSHAMA